MLAATAGAGACAAAAALVLILRSGGPAPVPLAQRTVVAPPFVAAGAEAATLGRAGDWLRTQSASMQFYASDGSSLRLSPSSDLELVRGDAQRWLRLRAGTVAVHVAKLTAGERFVIMTPDAEVEVRGTRFEVDVVPPIPGCGDGTVTRVVVTEGVVEVRGAGGDVRVPAGRRWPATCDQKAAATTTPAASAPLARASRPHSRAIAGATQAVPATIRAEAPAFVPPAASTLATENDLFSSALRAEHNGDRREAVELLDVLLTRFPASPLRASAASARDRLSRSLSPAP